MHETQRYEIGLNQMQKVKNSSGIALFTPFGWSGGGGGGNKKKMNWEKNKVKRRKVG